MNQVEVSYCSGCQQHLTLSSFGKDKYRSSGLTSKCKKCRNAVGKKWCLENPDKVKEINNKNKVKRKEYYSQPDVKLKYRKAWVERTFNIPYSEYERMYDEQGGVCAVCKQPETSVKNEHLSIDHCHDTGIVRGLLCNNCNRGIGLLKDSYEVLKNAVDYLFNFKESILVNQPNPCM